MSSPTASNDGRLAYFRAVEIVGDERDSHPTLEVLDWENPPTSTTAERAVHRLPTKGRTDLITAYRYHSDPYRAAITTISKGRRRPQRMLPAWATSWSDLEDILATWFDF